jgi:hypothetical protein
VGFAKLAFRLLRLLFFCGVLYNSECFSARSSSSLALGAIVVIFSAGLHSSEVLHASLFPVISSMFIFLVWVSYLFFFFGFSLVEFFRECAVSLFASVDPSIDK